MIKIILVCVLTTLISNSYAWEFFKKDDPKLDFASPLTTSEFAQLKITGNAGRGNTLNLKIYNGLPAIVSCSTVRFNEGKSSSYPITIQPGVFEDDDGGIQNNSTSFFPHTITKLRVQAFNLNKATSFNVEGCTCTRNINTKQCE